MPQRGSVEKGEEQCRSVTFIYTYTGLMANPAASLVNLDPFGVSSVPQISVMPATPESSIRSAGNGFRNMDRYNDCQMDDFQQKQNPRIAALKTMEFNNEIDVSPDDSPQTDEHPYHSLSSSLATLRRFGTVSSLERVASDEREDDIVENGNVDESSDENEDEDEEDVDDEGGIDNEAFNHSAIRHWTIRAGTFVAEKMAFFEKLGEDYKSGGFFDRYLKSNENHVNGDDQQEDETSGATSGEEIWGTPTSGGEMDDNLSPGYEGKQSVRLDVDN